MAGKLTNFYKIVTPKNTKDKYVATDYNNAANSTFNNYSWYANVVKGSVSRTSRYLQYDNMDLDPDVAKALDTIAEEMTGEDLNSGMILDLEFFNDDTKEIHPSVIVTLKAALRQFIKLNELDSTLFNIARTSIKYGDCFFVKTSDFKKWRYVRPVDVVGVIIDSEGTPIKYIINKPSFENASGSPLGNNFNPTGFSKKVEDQVDVYDADAVVHFCQEKGFEDNGVFGLSVLHSVIRPFKQLQLLEGAVLIYRIVRAPERRAFYIDTGTAVGYKQKATLEAHKNEYKQKRFANTSGGTEDIDAVLDPLSTVEDFYFAVNGANGRGSKVEILQGGDNLGDITDLNYFQKRVFRGLKIPTSYMTGSDAQGAQFQDGKTGIAFIEEMSFSNYVKRLQNPISNTLDYHFKIYLKASKINIDHNLFRIKLPVAQNFTAYRKAQLMGELLNSMSSVDNLGYISKRFAMKLVLNLSEDDIQINEELVKKEKGIPDEGMRGVDAIRMIYDKTLEEKIPAGNLEETENAQSTLMGDDAEGMLPDDSEPSYESPDTNVPSEDALPFDQESSDEPLSDITGKTLGDLLSKDKSTDSTATEEETSFLNTDDENSDGIFAELPETAKVKTPTLQDLLSKKPLNSEDNEDDSPLAKLFKKVNTDNVSHGKTLADLFTHDDNKEKLSKKTLNDLFDKKDVKPKTKPKLTLKSLLQK